MNLRSRRQFWSLAGLTVLAVAPMAILAVVAMGTAAGPNGPRQTEDRASWALLPLAAARQDLAALAYPPTAAATATPTDTLTPVPTSTPVPTATPTEVVCGPLRDRVRVRSIDVAPADVRVSSNRGRTTYPVYLAPLAGGGAKIAWSDSNRGVHLTTVDADDQRIGHDIELNGDEVRGLVAHEDGSTAMMVVSGKVLSFVKLDADGEQVIRKDYLGLQSETTIGSKWVDDWGHEARLVWAEGKYGLYSGHTQYFGAQGKHQGDLFWFFDANGERIDVPRQGWDWGCSHSLDLRLAHNGVRFGPACLSDAYPQPGFHFNHREIEIRREPSGDGSGGSDARLGGWVPLDDGFLMSFASPEGRSSTDVGILKVYNDATKDPAVWLTNTANLTEDAPHLARYGQDEFLASWMVNTNHLIATVDEEGTLLDGPAVIDARIGARDDFQTMPDGDVAWAWAWDDLSELKVVRVDACGSAPVFTPVPPTVTNTPVGPTTVPTAGPSPTPTTPPTAGPQVCRNVLTNGDFEDGLAGWTYDGETGLAFSDRSGGKYGVELLGRNDVMANVRQRVTVPSGAASAHLVYWWKMTSAEAVTSTKPYDTVSVAVDGSTAPPGSLEMLSNLAGRDGWLPSAYQLPLGSTRELVFHAEGNRRDATTYLIDDVQLVVCTGTAADYPAVAVHPESGPPGTEFRGTGVGFQPSESVSHWALEPATFLRFDLGAGAAGGNGAVDLPFQVRDTAGAWRWGVVGRDSQLPGTAGFTVSGAQ